MASADYAHHFSSVNIPFGIASSRAHGTPQPVTRIRNTVLFLHDLHLAGLFSKVKGLDDTVFLQPTLNGFAALPKPAHRGVRDAITDAFDKGGLDAFPREAREDIDHVSMHLPVQVGDFVGSWTPLPIAP